MMTPTSAATDIPGNYTYYADVTDGVPSAGMIRLVERMLYISNVYVNPVIGVIGLVSNTVAAFALWRRAKKHSTFNYLLGIAWSDSVFLGSVTLALALLYGAEVDLRQRTHCSLVYLLNYLPSQFSSWLLSAACIERVMCVYRPTKAKVWFTPRRARVAMATIGAIVMAANWHLLGGLKNTPLEGTEDDVYNWCRGRNAALDTYQRTVYPWVDAAMYSFLPSSALIVANIAIAAKFISARRKVSPAAVALTTMSKASLRTTVMAVSLSVMFLVTTMPVVLSVVVFSTVDVGEHGHLRAGIVLSVANSFSLINHCGNLWLYVSLSKSFRKDVRSLLTGRWRQVLLAARASSADGTQAGTSRLDGQRELGGNNLLVPEIAVIELSTFQ